ncbi:MAG TPA: PQQ-binding-like beta-propeller repeat protein, partial [Ktedonobacteraceae bacterium]|nr:PQQ-binding-like beta-propeller repeat protein [Ktedonobacteraceae bacterium]
MGSNAHTGFNRYETLLNANSARNLKLHWVYKAGGWISSQVIVANSMLYWGSADGYEHAMDLNGHLLWQTFLGSVPHAPPACFPTSAGVTAPATVSNISIHGKMTPVVFVGGGDTQLYALNANNGNIIWRTRLGTPPNMMIWAGASVYKDSVYVGRASYGDCPLEPGEMFQLDAATGAIQNSFVTVPAGCVGGGIWMTPTIDEASGTVYVSTGTINACSTYERYSYALLEFKAKPLSLIRAWQIPKKQQGNDDDFGSTPTLFTATIGGTVHRMIGLVNKNGIYYAL